MPRRISALLAALLLLSLGVVSYGQGRGLPAPPPGENDTLEQKRQYVLGTMLQEFSDKPEMHDQIRATVANMSSQRVDQLVATYAKRAGLAQQDQAEATNRQANIARYQARRAGQQAEAAQQAAAQQAAAQRQAVAAGTTVGVPYFYGPGGYYPPYYTPYVYGQPVAYAPVVQWFPTGTSLGASAVVSISQPVAEGSPRSSTSAPPWTSM